MDLGAHVGQNWFKKTDWFPPLALRTSLGVVFLLFGIDQFENPDRWTSWVPGWLGKRVGTDTIVLATAIFHTVTAWLLIAGLLSRLAALAIVAFLAAVLISIGVDDTTTRDIGLLGEGIALVVIGGGRLSLDSLLLYRRKGLPVV